MEKKEVFDLIKLYFSTEFEIPEEKIIPAASLSDDLGLDSIDALDMSGMLEAELDIEVEMDDLKLIKTVQDVIDYIMKNK
jgi:acyl carrier protein